MEPLFHRLLIDIARVKALIKLNAKNNKIIEELSVADHTLLILQELFFTVKIDGYNIYILTRSIVSEAKEISILDKTGKTVYNEFIYL